MRLNPVKSTSAVTFIELIIATSIFTVIAITIYSAFHSGITGYKNISGVIDLHQSAGSLLSRLNSELRNSFACAKDAPGFKGDKDRISFFALADVYTQGRIDREYAYISYAQSLDKLTRVCLRGKDSMMDPSGVKPEEFISNIESIRFSYGVYDREGLILNWLDSWQDKKVLPDAVKVVLILKDKVPYNFERTIFLRIIDK